MICSTFKKKNFGFTLIELLIVIAIIAVLTAFGAAAYSRIQAGSRDTQRKADLAKIRGALEQYYSDHDSYAAQISDLGSYLNNNIPTDPKNTGDYVYTYSPTTTHQTYQLCANLETGGTGSSACSGTYNYILTPND